MMTPRWLDTPGASKSVPGRRWVIIPVISLLSLTFPLAHSLSTFRLHLSLHLHLSLPPPPSFPHLRSSPDLPARRPPRSGTKEKVRPPPSTCRRKLGGATRGSLQ